MFWIDNLIFPFFNIEINKNAQMAVWEKKNASLRKSNTEARFLAKVYHIKYGSV